MSAFEEFVSRRETNDDMFLEQASMTLVSNAVILLDLLVKSGKLELPAGKSFEQMFNLIQMARIATDVRPNADLEEQTSKAAKIIQPYIVSTMAGIAAWAMGCVPLSTANSRSVDEMKKICDIFAKVFSDSTEAHLDSLRRENRDGDPT